MSAIQAASFPAQLWQQISNGENTLPRLHLDDSGSFSSTPGTGVVLYTLFRARTGGTYKTVTFQTGGTAQSAITLSKAGLYQQTAAGGLTLLSGSASTAFSGTFNANSLTLGTAQALAVNSVYAIGLLQVGTTPASLLGAWFNGMFDVGTPVFAQTQTRAG